MERLIRESQVDAVIDLTTTDVADEFFEGCWLLVQRGWKLARRCASQR
jgi:Uncharacterised protein family (UPF0261)